MALTGLGDVIRNLNLAIAKIEGGSVRGLKKAALFIEGESNETVPQDKGILINSSFSQVDPQLKRARIGYTAKYAPFVHEMPASFNYTKPGTGPKFLQKAIAENQSSILSIIAKEAKI